MGMLPLSNWTWLRPGGRQFLALQAGGLPPAVAGSRVIDRCMRMSLRRIIILAVLFAALAVTPRPLRAADSVPPGVPPRFLFIVEKSQATRAHGLDLPQTMFDLVYRGANGHLPDGGVFEIWLFGEETIFRGFPPQMLTPNNRLPLASRASAYVRQAKSGGPADISKLVEHVRSASELGMELTIILVTAPDTRLSGTPRDAEINGVFEANAELQRTAGRPFITAIRVQDGVIAASTVNDSPFTMVMPPMPLSQLTEEERERRLAIAQQARLAREKAAAPPAVAVPTPVVIQRRTDIPDEEREGAIILKGNPRANQPPPPVAVTESAVTAVTAVATPVAAEATDTSKTGAPAANPVAPPLGAQAAAGGEAKGPTNGAASQSPAVAPGQPVTNAAAGATNLIPQTAVTVPARSWFTAGGLFVAGLGFFVVAALLAWVLMRRARAAAGPSYITRSIEHRRE